MKPKWVLIATGVLYLVSGCVALIAPAKQLALYGVSQGSIQNHIAQWAGLGSVTIGMFAVLAGRATAPSQTQGALWVMLIYFLISGSISVMGTLSGVMASLPGWLLSAEGLLLAGLYALVLARSVRSAESVRDQEQS